MRPPAQARYEGDSTCGAAPDLRAFLSGDAAEGGLFDTEALITRRVLAKLIERPAAPVNVASPFTVDLTAPPFSALP